MIYLLALINESNVLFPLSFMEVLLHEFENVIDIDDLLFKCRWSFTR